MIPVPENADDLLYESSIESEPPSSLSNGSIRIITDKEKASMAARAMSV